MINNLESHLHLNFKTTSLVNIWKYSGLQDIGFAATETKPQGVSQKKKKIPTYVKMY